MNYKTGDVVQHRLIGDKAVIVMIPIALPMKDSKNFHQDDFIDLNSGDWFIVENENLVLPREEAGGEVIDN